MFFSELGKVFIEFLYAPFIYPDMFWIILPLFLSIGLMELYFKKYSREGIGHHKSLENTIFLVFFFPSKFIDNEILTIIIIEIAEIPIILLFIIQIINSIIKNIFYLAN